MSIESGNSVRWTNNLRDVKSVKVTLPAIVPTSIDHESSISLVVGHVRVLTRRWDVVEDIWVGGEVVPLHGTNIQVARAVGAVTEASLDTFLVLVLLTTEDEELPGWNSLYEGGAVVPSWHADNEVIVLPLFGLEVVEPHVVEVHLRVPASIDVQLAFVGEETVATTTIRQLLGH